MDQTTSTENNHHVYLIREVGTTGPVYVGCTMDPVERLAEHTLGSRYYDTRFAKWMQGMVTRLDNEIEMIILETPDESNWRDRERAWLEKLKEDGVEVLNMRRAGQGNSLVSTESRKRMSQARVGRKMSKTARMKIAFTGRMRFKLNPNLKQNLGAAMKTQAGKFKLSRILLGRHFNTSHKKKLSEALKGVPKTEQHSANIVRQRRMSDQEILRLRSEVPTLFATGLSQVQVGKLLGVSQGYVSRILSGKGRLTRAEKQAIRDQKKLQKKMSKTV